MGWLLSIFVQTWSLRIQSNLMSSTINVPYQKNSEQSFAIQTESEQSRAHPRKPAQRCLTTSHVCEVSSPGEGLWCAQTRRIAAYTVPLLLAFANALALRTYRAPKAHITCRRRISRAARHISRAPGTYHASRKKRVSPSQFCNRLTLF